jgi:DNA-binding NtrC family response regulator
VVDKSETLSMVEPARKREVPRAPHLFLELEGDRPLAGPARWCLAGLEQVRLGRGAARGSRTADGALSIEIPDSRMSGAHAELRPDGLRWVIQDLRSKNGTLVDGCLVEEAPLADGALVQLGHTLLRFRADAPSLEPASLDFESVPGGPTPLSTQSAAYGAVLARAAAAAPSRVPILLVGESGTGKEVLARHIHALSGRSGALVAVNCGALAPNLVEAELFGHRRGAFTGAAHDRPGLVRASDRGTLFLDEIGDLPAPAQAALLRVIQEAEVRPVGGHQAQPLDLRVLAATHRNLRQLVQEGQFRHDLLARLDGITLVLPPLRERTEDIPLLIAVLLRKLAPERPEVKLSPAAAEALLRHNWPLNVRELEQALAGALALSGAGPLEEDHLPVELIAVEAEQPGRALTPDELRDREELVRLLEEHGGNVSAVARALGKGRTQVVRWIARYRIDVRKPR